MEALAKLGTHGPNGIMPPFERSARLGVYLKVQKDPVVGCC